MALEVGATSMVEIFPLLFDYDPVFGFSNAWHVGAITTIENICPILYVCVND